MRPGKQRRRRVRRRATAPRAVGIEADVVLLASSADLRGDAATAHETAVEAGVRVAEATDGATWARLRDRALSRGIVVDAMLGTGQLYSAVAEFQKRDRRFGKLSDKQSGDSTRRWDTVERFLKSVATL